jgi:hypothetical protein
LSKSDLLSTKKRIFCQTDREKSVVL